MTSEDSRQVIEALVRRVDLQRHQLQDIKEKLDHLHQEIRREIAQGPLSRDLFRDVLAFGPSESQPHDDSNAA